MMQTIAAPLDSLTSLVPWEFDQQFGCHNLAAHTLSKGSQKYQAGEQELPSDK
jgi:hypothetical protein